MAKKEKAVSPKKQPKATAQEGVKPKKKKKLGGLILFLLLILIIAGAAVCYLYDYFGVKTMVVQYFVSQDDQYQLAVNDLEARYVKYNEDLAALEGREAELLAAQAELDSRSLSLDAREAKLKTESEDLILKTTQFQTAAVEYDQVVETVNGMNAANAAEMLRQMQSINQVARLLAALEPKKAATILAQIPANEAAAITEELIRLSSGN